MRRRLMYWFIAACAHFGATLGFALGYFAAGSLGAALGFGFVAVFSGVWVYHARRRWLAAPWPTATEQAEAP